MKSEELQRLTASEPLTLEQEYAMQRSWREDGDSEKRDPGLGWAGGGRADSRSGLQGPSHSFFPRCGPAEASSKPVKGLRGACNPPTLMSLNRVPVAETFVLSLAPWAGWGGFKGSILGCGCNCGPAPHILCGSPV